MVDKALQDVEQISKELLDLADSGKKNSFNNFSCIKSYLVEKNPKMLRLFFFILSFIHSIMLSFNLKY